MLRLACQLQSLNLSTGETSSSALCQYSCDLSIVVPPATGMDMLSRTLERSACWCRKRCLSLGCTKTRRLYVPQAMRKQPQLSFFGYHCSDQERSTAQPNQEICYRLDLESRVLRPSSSFTCVALPLCCSTILRSDTKINHPRAVQQHNTKTWLVLTSTYISSHQ